MVCCFFDEQVEVALGPKVGTLHKPSISSVFQNDIGFYLR